MFKRRPIWQALTNWKVSVQEFSESRVTTCTLWKPPSGPTGMTSRPPIRSCSLSGCGTWSCAQRIPGWNHLCI